MTPKEAREILETAKAKNRTDYPLDYAVAMEMAITTLGAIEQIMWERDMAISQLEEIGVSFGEKMDEVKEALEKQIPKKPTKLTYKLLIDAGWIYACPNCKMACGENKYHLEATSDEMYCPSCGQAIDFEELE